MRETSRTTSESTYKLLPDGEARSMQREHQHTRRLQRLLSIILAGLLIILSASGAALAVYFAPIHTVERFCRALATQEDAQAYQLVTVSFQRQHSLEQFTRSMRMLDDVEGRITDCEDMGIAGLTSIDLLAGRLDVTTTLRHGQHSEMRGHAHLRFDDGAWRIDRLDSSFLGVDLGAVETALTFCDALQRQNYGAVFTLLNANDLSTTTELEFTAQGRAWDQIGGQASACEVAGIEGRDTDTFAQLAISVTRTRAGMLSGVMTLTRGDKDWTIQSLDQMVLGADLGPLVVGRQFCANLSHGEFHRAYLLLSRSLRALLPERDGRWLSYATPGLRWTCMPDFVTYITKGNSASYVVIAQVTNVTTGKTAKLPRLLFTFVREEGTWMLDNITTPT